MAALDRIVSVTISRQTTVPSMASFNGILIPSEFLASKPTTPFDADERVRVYGGIDEIAADGWTDSDFFYKAAAAVFMQNPSVDKIYCGRKLTSSDGTESWDAALTAMLAYNNAWYGIAASTRTEGDQEDIADWTETNKKFYMAASDDTGILSGGGTSDIAYYAQSKKYSRTAVIFDPAADTVDEACADAAWIGNQFPYAPGSTNYAFKTLVGIVAAKLTTAQITAALAKAANIYTSIADVNVTQDGTVGSGDFIDVIIGTDWLQANIQNKVFTPMVQQPKIPFSDTGVQMVVNPLKGALQDAVAVGFLSDAPGDIAITYPKVADVSALNKSLRKLPDVKFTVRLAGAFNHIVISGTLVL